MVKRRSMVIGLGALATGSGAAFSSASLTSTAESNAEIRVVVDQALVVRAGENAVNEGRIEGNVSSPESYLFGDSDSDVLNETDSGPDWGTVRGDGKAAVNDETNEDLALAIATPSSGADFTSILEVANEGDTDAEVGIDIASYGEDVGSDSDIPESDVDKAFTFSIDDTTVGPDDSTTASVDIGDTEQVDIDIDMGKIDNSDIANASDPQEDGNGDIFSRDGAAVDTVDLVDTIQFSAENLDS